MTFGTKLQKLRVEKNMSQKEVSDILEVSQTIYGKWESDIFFPTYKNLKKIAAFYVLDVESLTDCKENINRIQESNFLNKISNSNSQKKILKLLTKVEKALFLLKKQIENLETKNEK